jgi:hypothetical protein
MSESLRIGSSPTGNFGTIPRARARGGAEGDSRLWLRLILTTPNCCAFHISRHITTSCENLINGSISEIINFFLRNL